SPRRQTMPRGIVRISTVSHSGDFLAPAPIVIMTSDDDVDRAVLAYLATHPVRRRDRERRARALDHLRIGRTAAAPRRDRAAVPADALPRRLVVSAPARRRRPRRAAPCN